MKVVGYVRISNEERALAGYGLAAQETSVRAYCVARGWDLVRLYVDAGRSAKDIAGRPELRRLLDAAENPAVRDFEAVVVWKLDRLSRRLPDMLSLFDRLEPKGVAVVSIVENVDGSTATGRMLRNILGSFGQFEREQTSERIKAANAERARQGKLVGPLPLGYTRAQSTEETLPDGRRRIAPGPVVLDPMTAPLVHEAFRRYATGKFSLREMAQWSGEVGLLSKEGNPIDRLGWRKLLTNSTYTGAVSRYLRQGGGVVAERGEHPQLVDIDLFRQVQEALTERRMSYTPQRPFGKHPYPLTGITLCGYCDAPLLGVAAGARKTAYMRCSTAARLGKAACHQPMVAAAVLEGQVGDYLSNMRVSMDYISAAVVEYRSRPIRGNGAGITERVRRELKRWQRLYATGEMDESDYKRETAPLRRQLAAQERPREVATAAVAMNRLRDIGALWKASSKERQRDFLREVFTRVVAEGPQIVSLMPRDDFAPLFVVDRAERHNADVQYCSPATCSGSQLQLPCCDAPGISIPPPWSAAVGATVPGRCSRPRSLGGCASGASGSVRFTA